MIIQIKNKQYINPDWRVEKGVALFRFATDASFAQIIEDFSLNAGDEITQLNDNEEVIGKWYVDGMASIKMPGDEDGEDQVVIKYYVSQLGHDAQMALNEDMDTATITILELASLVSRLKTSYDEAEKRMKQAEEEYQRSYTEMRELLNHHTNSISQWETSYNRLADRVATLENRG